MESQALHIYPMSVFTGLDFVANEFSSKFSNVEQISHFISGMAHM